MSYEESIEKTALIISRHVHLTVYPTGELEAKVNAYKAKYLAIAAAILAPHLREIAIERERADKADAKVVALAAERDECRRAAHALLERNSELRRKLEVAEAINKLTERAQDVRNL